MLYLNPNLGTPHSTPCLLSLNNSEITQLVTFSKNSLETPMPNLVPQTHSGPPIAHKIQMGFFSISGQISYKQNMS